MTRFLVTVLAVLSLGFVGCGEDEPESADATVSTTSGTTADAAPTSTETAPTGETGEGQGEGEPPAAQEDAQGAGGEPAATPEAAIRAVLTGAGDAEQACTDFVTPQFVTMAYGGRANCVAARRPSALADSLRITDEGAGKFTVVPEGGPYNGVEVMVEVVDEDGYRVSSLLADIPAGP